MKRQGTPCEAAACERPKKCFNYCYRHHHEICKSDLAPVVRCDGDRGRGRRTHGLGNTAEYHSWEHMRSRCNNPADKNYKDYGGRGITVCSHWDKFLNFLADMGKRPTLKHTIERVNNDGNYEPSNCKWATRKEQASNRRLRPAEIRTRLRGAIKEVTHG